MPATLTRRETLSQRTDAAGQGSSSILNSILLRTTDVQYIEDPKCMYVCMYVCLSGFYYPLRAVHYLCGTASIHTLAEMYVVLCIQTIPQKYSFYMFSVPIPH